MLLQQDDSRFDDASALLHEAASAYRALGMKAYARNAAERSEQLTRSGGAWPIR
jgi:hypothetical protein